MKYGPSLLSAFAVFTAFAGLQPQASAQIALGSAANFEVLAGAGITVAGAVNSTTIRGDIGTFPTLSITGAGNIVLIGTNHGGDSITQAGKTSLVTAYAAAAGATPTTTYTPIKDLGGLTLPPGVYNDPSSFAITGLLKLDALGDPNAVFIFQAGSTLTAATGSEVRLINGAQAANVFWQVGSSATLNGSAIFKGTILALSDITLVTGANVEGRLLARNGFVALDTNTLALPLTVQTITFAPIASRTACDVPFTLAPTASSGLPVTLAVTSGPATVSGNTVTLTGAIGTVVLTASQAGNGTFAAATSVVQSFGVAACVVPLTAQTITFPSIAGRTACDAPFTIVLPVATSGLPVTLAVSGPATVSGNTVTLTGATGTVVLTASQAGNGTFAAASSVVQNFAVAACVVVPPTAQTITFPSIAGHTACDAPFTIVLPVATSGLPVTLAVSGPATVSGNTVTLTGAIGTVVLTASQAGNGTFAAASSVVQSAIVVACVPPPTAQTITFAAIAGRTACDAPFTFVAPVSSSGLPVTLTISGPATVSGNTVTLTGAIGTVVLTASQAGNGTFAAASSVAQSIVVAACAPPPTLQTITFAALSGHTACDAPFTFVLPAATSGLPVTLAVSGPATVSGNTVTLTGAQGTVVITASQAGNTTFAAAPSVTQSFVVGVCPKLPVITSPFDVQFNGQPLTPNIQLGTVGTPFPGYQITATGSPTSFSAINLPPGMAVNPLSGAITGTPTAADVWFVTVRASNATGTGDALVIFEMVPAEFSRIVNFSARALSGPGSQTLAMGFVISGNTKNVLVRAVGPTLTAFGLTNVLPDPLLTLSRNNRALATNDDWQTGQDGPTIASTAARVGAFALPNGSKDSALIAVLDAGAHTLTVARPDSASGIVLAEIYDTDANFAARLINVSARIQVGVDENALTAGFVIAGNVPKTVLIRGIGPTLSVFGVGGVLVDPTIALFSGRTQMAANDNWETGASTAAQISSAAARVGAFALPAGSKDAVLLMTLPPGAYTVLVTGVARTIGVALLEIYDVQ